MYCPNCFSTHNEAHSFGVTFNEESCAALLKWNEFVFERLGQIINDMINEGYKGYSSVFVLRLDSQFPRNKIGEISKVEIEKVAVRILSDFKETLQANINRMTNASSIQDLKTPEFLKDLNKFFLEDTGHILKPLIEELERNIRTEYPSKKIYEYCYFLFNLKQISQI